MLVNLSITLVPMLNLLQYDTTANELSQFIIHSVDLEAVKDEMSEKRASRVSTTQSLSAISENGVADDDMVDVHVTTAPDGGYGWVSV